MILLLSANSFLFLLEKFPFTELLIIPPIFLDVLDGLSTSTDESKIHCHDKFVVFPAIEVNLLEVNSE